MEENSNRSYRMEHLQRQQSPRLNNTHLAQDSNPYIPKHLNIQLLSAINIDQVQQLAQLIQQTDISLQFSINNQRQWGILHQCCQHNAKECLQYLLKYIYRCNQSNTNYQQIVNLQSEDGQSILMVAIRYKSNQCVELLLKYGGIDIMALDDKKMDAFQIAKQYNNLKIIPKLQQYQLLNKQKLYINQQLLLSEITIKRQLSFSKIITKLFLCCIPLELFHNHPVVDNQHTQLLSRYSNYNNVQIQWRQPKHYFKRSLPLFHKFNPSSIHSNILPIRNLSILFQQLCKFPHVLKQIITSHNAGYMVKLVVNNCLTNIYVQNLFPYLKHSHQMVFISSKEQLWPAVLVKALAICHKNYYELNKTSDSLLLYQITGSMTYTIPLSSIKEILMQQIQDSLSNSIILCKFNKKSQMVPPDHIRKSFSIAKIIDIFGKNSFLINCPFVTNHNSFKSQKHIAPEKEPNQLCLTKQQFINEVNSLLITTILHQHNNRSSIKFKPTSRIIYFTIQTESTQPNSSYFGIYGNCDHLVLKISSCKIWKSNGLENVDVIIRNNFIILQNNKGKYLFQIQLQHQFNGQPQQMLIVGWGSNHYNLSVLDNNIGDIQYVQALVNYLSINQISEPFNLIQLQSLTIIYIKTYKPQCYTRMIGYQSISYLKLIQGVKRSDSIIQLRKIDRVPIFISVLQIKPINAIKFQTCQKVV